MIFIILTYECHQDQLEATARRAIRAAGEAKRLTEELKEGPSVPQDSSSSAHF